MQLDNKNFKIESGSSILKGKHNFLISFQYNGHINNYYSEANKHGKWVETGKAETVLFGKQPVSTF